MSRALMQAKSESALKIPEETAKANDQRRPIPSGPHGYPGRRARASRTSSSSSFAHRGHRTRARTGVNLAVAGLVLGLQARPRCRHHPDPPPPPGGTRIEGAMCPKNITPFGQIGVTNGGVIACGPPRASPLVYAPKISALSARPLGASRTHERSIPAIQPFSRTRSRLYGPSERL